MVQKLNRFKAKLNKHGELTYEKNELAVCFDTVKKESTAQEEEVEILVLPIKDKVKSQSKAKIASHKISQVEFLSKKLNLDENSTFLLLSSFACFKK